MKGDIKEVFLYGKSKGEAEAYKYAFDKLIEIAKEQNSTTAKHEYFGSANTFGE